MSRTDDRLITVQDVYNTIAEHLHMLDKLWPEGERFGPRKVHIVELLDAIKLRLVQRAETNANRYETPFEKAAAKITGAGKMMPAPAPDATAGRTSMQQAHEEAKARMKR